MRARLCTHATNTPRPTPPPTSFSSLPIPKHSPESSSLSLSRVPLLSIRSTILPSALARAPLITLRTRRSILYSTRAFLELTREWPSCFSFSLSLEELLGSNFTEGFFFLLLSTTCLFLSGDKMSCANEQQRERGERERERVFQGERLIRLRLLKACVSGLDVVNTPISHAAFAWTVLYRSSRNFFSLSLSRARQVFLLVLHEIKPVSFRSNK